MDFPPFALVYHKRAKSPSHAGPKQTVQGEPGMDIVKTIIIFLIAVSFAAANCFAASGVPDPDSLPKCKGKTCYVKARPEPWPQEPVKDGIKVKYRFVRLLVPEQIDYYSGN
jgi:hypothetical protein